MKMTPKEAFEKEALAAMQAQIARLRESLTYAGALALPEARGEDIVVARKEVQLMIYRQSNIQSLAGKVLVTVQLARHAMGGVPTYHLERGLIFSSDDTVREATEQELVNSRHA